MEASANGIQNGLRFQLSSISGVVYNNRGVQDATVFIPVLDIFLNELILNTFFDPVFLFISGEAISDTILSFFPFQFFDLIMCVFRAVFIQLATAFVMDLFDVVPEDLSVVGFLI